MPIVGNKHFDYTPKGIAAAKAASAASGTPMSTAGGKSKKKKKWIKSMTFLSRRMTKKFVFSEHLDLANLN